MDIFNQLLVIRLIIILGVINLITGALVFFSCRCLGGSGLNQRLMKHRGYRRFYKYHCYIWRVFWPAVMLHAILVIVFYGWPG